MVGILEKVIVPFKRLVDIDVPARATEGSAGYDLQSAINGFILPGDSLPVPTGIAVEIPEYYVGIVMPRSGLAFKHNVTSHIGVIDSDYRGEIKALLHNNGLNSYEVRKGDRIAQLLILPVAIASFTEVEELSNTERGSDGFGSTGK